MQCFITGYLIPLVDDVPTYRWASTACSGHYHSCTAMSLSSCASSSTARCAEDNLYLFNEGEAQVQASVKAVVPRPRQVDHQVGLRVGPLRHQQLDTSNP